MLARPASPGLLIYFMFCLYFTAVSLASFSTLAFHFEPPEAARQHLRHSLSSLAQFSSYVLSLPVFCQSQCYQALCCCVTKTPSRQTPPFPLSLPRETSQTTRPFLSLPCISNFRSRRSPKVTPTFEVVLAAPHFQIPISFSVMYHYVKKVTWKLTGLKQQAFH